ncbi:MAG: hypothetical protein Q9160_005422 [Pyrenula sp. 1 TL-2023]
MAFQNVNETVDRSESYRTGNAPAAQQNPPPSSILATHLAPVNGNGTALHFDRESFAQLLEESLGLDDNGHPNLGNDASINHKLICIIVKAGLDHVLHQPEDPFLADDEESKIVLEACNCLEVLELAIERCPLVVFELSGENEPNEGDRDVPLFLWLFPRLLRFLCNRDFHSPKVENKVWSIFDRVFSFESKCAPASRFCKSIREYAQQLIIELISSLAGSSSLTSGPSANVSMGIPSSFFTECLESLNLQGSRLNIELHFSSFCRMVDVCSALIRSACLATNEDASQQSISLRQRLSWSLDQHRNLWDTTTKYALMAGDFGLKIQSSFFALFENLKAVLLATSAGEPCLLTQKGALLWVQCLSEFISNCLSRSHLANEDALSNVFSMTTILAASVPAMRDAIQDILIPSLSSSNQLQMTASDNNSSRHVKEFLDQQDHLTKQSATEIVSAKTDEVNSAEIVESGRARKRLRLSREEDHGQDETLCQKLIRHVYRILGSQDVSDLTGLSRIAPSNFKKLSEDNQCQTIAELGLIACAGSQSLRQNTLDDQNNASCSICDEDDLSPTVNRNVWEDAQIVELSSIVGELISSMQKAPKAKVLGMLALRRILLHSSNLASYRLSQSRLGQWCLQSLQSSVRELRVAAAHTLSTFMTTNPHIPPNIIRSNRIYGLDYLQNLLQKGKIAVQETCILCLSHVAQVSGDEELNLILVRFVEYLGYANPYISGLVYGEILKIAQVRKVTAIGLMKPFWRTIAVVVVKNFQNRPAIAQNLCELIGMKVPSFLVMTQEHTLPYLVLAQRKEMILKIAAASGQSVSPYELCTRKANFASILAYLLSQSSSDLEQLAMSLLTEVSPEFRGQELSTWIKLEPILITCELVKGMADAGEGKASKLHQALRLLATLDARTSRKGDIVGQFLEDYVLAIITEFNNTLNDNQLKQPNMEKRRCLAAIGQLIKLGKNRVGVALPQICACLRSAMENQQLCDPAFEAWAVMMTVLKEEDMGPLIDQTLAIIVRFWDGFQPETQERAYNVISDILKNHTALIREAFNTMPSLATIPVMSKFENEIESLKRQMDLKHQFMAFAKRARDENPAVVEQCLSELATHLQKHQEFMHQAALNEKTDPVVAELIRSVLDCAVKFASSTRVHILCAQCLGLIGCIDPNQVETVREKPEIVMLSNFAREDETMDFVMFFIQRVLVKAFLSASNTRSQGFLAWAMQELLRLCDLDKMIGSRTDDITTNDKYRRWIDLPEEIRNVLTPFITSRYNLTAANVQEDCSYPLFTPSLSYADWLRTTALDLLQKGSVPNAATVFAVVQRIIRGQDLSIAEFLLPFATLNVILGGTEKQKNDVVRELLNILEQPLAGSHVEKENVKLCSERVFNVLDHISKWHQMKKKDSQSPSGRSERGANSTSKEVTAALIKTAEQVLAAIPPDLISRRAIECNSYARALFQWEQHIRRKDSDAEAAHDSLLERLQEIYAQIDEPDGIEGISAHMQVLKIDQQVLEHKKAGRWTAAQSWYEMQLTDRPDEIDVQVNLLTCLKESGQHEVLLNHFESLYPTSSLPKTLPYAIEASWVTGRWDMLSKYASQTPNNLEDFTQGIGNALVELHRGDHDSFNDSINELRKALAGGLTKATTASLQSCHDTLLRLHAVNELEEISNVQADDKPALNAVLDRRLDVLGSYVADKHYILGLRKAAMELSPHFTQLDVAAAWLKTAKLARKSDSLNQAFSAVLHASHLGEKAATIEHAKLLWKEGHHRKAIQSLEGAIESGAFASHNFTSAGNTSVTLTSNQQQQQNVVTAKAHLLLARWLDYAGQTPSEVIKGTYRQAVNFHKRWEKGLYSLGKHYNKILDSEKTKPIGKESQAFLTGEAAKVVIDNYLRSLTQGSKYVFHTMPKVLTLWLDMVAGIDQPQDSRRGNEKFQNHYMAQRKRVIDETNAQVEKYVGRLQPVILYTILPQVVARICHPNQNVFKILVAMVVKIVKAFPQQSMWTLLAVIKSSNKERAQCGLTIARKVSEAAPKGKSGNKEAPASELRALMQTGQRFSEELLRVSDYPIEGRASRVSLARDLGFQHKIAPIRLVVPIEVALTPAFPTNTDTSSSKSFRPFPKEPITIDAFLDEASVLPSLQRPRKLTLRASNGKIYSLMAKPKDDLRKDARLMEFNTMVNRFLSKDVEASRRRLYIRTYSVVPLNEECGLLEWVENLKTFRDILLNTYRDRNISPNYVEIRSLLDTASATNDLAQIATNFTDNVLPRFPACFPDYFVETFPDPSTWLAARLRYTRSAAVMSIVGHVLGLGDRHGENILLEESTAGILHVDFNCLFDKGLTFEKPEAVPFRLTHNMVSAMGVYGYEGPFRRCAEITLALLRAHEDALLTVLETFVFDPTTEFVGAEAKKRKQAIAKGETFLDGVEVPSTPEGVLEGVRGNAIARDELPNQVPTEAHKTEGFVELFDLRIAKIRTPSSLAYGLHESFFQISRTTLPSQPAGVIKSLAHFQPQRKTRKSIPNVPGASYITFVSHKHPTFVQQKNFPQSRLQSHPLLCLCTTSGEALAVMPRLFGFSGVLESE